ncbi:hypothetical protein [Streptomyces similanensis]|uniref:Uncharacterized protein n=1 Tax=Streptomyces similanensis TaxID=1274988 RepID=A0ABP9L7V6_9ACTN
MSEDSARCFRTLAADVKALQQRVYDAVDGLDGLTSAESFKLGEAFASLGSAARTLDAAAAS